MLQCGRHLSNYATVRGDIMEHFITSVHINEVRHLKDIEIKLNPEKRQHLILTGKNGSGKTSVLQGSIRNCVFGDPINRMISFLNLKKLLPKHLQSIILE